MHILAGLLTLATVASIIVYRLYMISQSRLGQDISNAAGSVQKHMKRRAWNKKLGDPLREVDDPRIAAAAMMVALAQSDSSLSEREEAIIANQMTARFGTSEAVTAELLAYARWLVRDVTEAENCFLKVRPTILENCGPKEREELLSMMTAVAEAGTDLETQKATVARLAQTLRT